VDPENIEWRRPSEFWDFPSDPPVFLKAGASANDVKQGQIGNCWFISALSVLASREELLKGVTSSLDTTNGVLTPETMNKFSKGVYPPLFHCYRYKGMYVFRFFKNFQWLYVIIDDRLPCEIDGPPVFGQCKELNELWVPLIEKAYAKLHGCY